MLVSFAKGYHALCSALGRCLRSATYSRVADGVEGGAPTVTKRRAGYASALIALGNIALRLLGTGTRILSQREWEERETHLYGVLYGEEARATPGELELPKLPGVPLAELLRDPAVSRTHRERALRLSARALRRLHDLGYTHADAMASNVLVDMSRDEARWFDFETVHSTNESPVARRADDVRALLYTCAAAADGQELSRVVDVVLEAYGHEETGCAVARRARRLFPRPLAFHLGQAGLSFGRLRQLSAALSETQRLPT